MAVLKFNHVVKILSWADGELAESSSPWVGTKPLSEDGSTTKERKDVANKDAREIKEIFQQVIEKVSFNLSMEGDRDRGLNNNAGTLLTGKGN